MRHVCALKMVLIVGALSTAGCAELNQLNVALGGAKAPSVEPTATAQPTALGANAPQTADVLDTTTASERAAASGAGATGRSLGQTVASLGSPAEPGFWLKTPLVSDETMGKVRNPATGKTVAVTLIPIAGPETAGSRMSLAAMRLLGVNLTDLVTVDVSL
ncbi:hypothetical protein [uncultured Roseobacter sp.]|uniref:hypothetical protein n=1 Tax=uncultured Roseobacter sp. TaxID=114847 RepID=UPI00262C56D2|nr:hypothetical protein [uncultured Roseobacter sp.]